MHGHRRGYVAVTQLERQHSAVARQQLTDKLPRRTGGLLDVGGAGSSGLLPSHQSGSLAGTQDSGHQSSLGAASGQSQYLLSRYLRYIKIESASDRNVASYMYTRKLISDELKMVSTR